MEWKSKRCRFKFMNKMLLFYLVSIFFFSVCAMFSTISTKTLCLDFKCPSNGRADLHFQEFEKTGDEDINKLIGKRGSLSLARRYLSGPGSSPPRCTAKCGQCKPCKPVHVPVPPGTPVTAEYYPEAWRCKCGNKLYMP